MRRRVAHGVAAAMAFTALVGSMGAAQPVDATPPSASSEQPFDASPTGRYLVRVANPARTQATITQVAGARFVGRLHAVGGAAVVQADEATARRLAGTPGVLEVAADQPMSLADTQAGAPWGLDRIDQASLPLDGSYTFPTEGIGVTAYVLDSGVYDHPDFGGRVAVGTSTIDGGIGRVDCNGHGTHVAGTIGSATYGVAKAVTIVPIRVASCDGGLWLIDALEGVDWAIAHHTTGPAVLNASLGGSANSWWPTWVDAAIADGITMVVAAGNQYGANACNYSPANAPAAITVGSSDIDDRVSSFSNLGACVDLFAPGGSVLSLASSGSGTATKSGTSMATPHVAGAVALHLAAAPWLSPAQIADRVVGSTTQGALLGTLANAPNRLLRIHPTIHTPANDAVGKAMLLSVWGGEVDASNQWAGREPGEPQHASAPGAASVWFRFVVEVPGALTLSTAGSSFDTLLAVYTGTPMAGLAPVVANDNSPSGGFTSSVTFSPALGATYWVAVDGRDGQRGEGLLTPTFVPAAAAPNDSFSDASAISPDRALLVDTHTRGATHESGEPDHAGLSGAGSLWWRFNAPADGVLVVTSFGSSFDTVLAAYTGTDVAALSAVDTDDDTEGSQSQLTLQVAAGIEYHIALDGGTPDPVLGTGGVRLHTAFVADGTDRYRPLPTPVRLVDTRPTVAGVLEVVDEAQPFAPGEVRRLDVSSIEGLDGADSIAVNLTTVNQAATGFLQAYPCLTSGDPTPGTSALNFVANAAVANSALVRLAGNGFCIRASQTTNVVVDAVGAFAADTTSQPLLSPARLVDTRPGLPGLSSPTDETTPLAAGQVRRYEVPAADGLPIPGTYSAIVVNITAVTPATGGFAKAWPCATSADSPPPTSVLNFRAGVNTANAGVLGVHGGGFCVQASATTHLVVDITGVFANQAGTVSNALPQRLLDTRAFGMGAAEYADGIDTAVPLAAGEVTMLTLEAQAGIPAGDVAAAAIVNVTAVGATAPGFVTIWPCADATSTPPRVSTLNFRPGAATSNGAWVGLTDTAVCVMASQSTHLVVDVTGWHAATTG